MSAERPGGRGLVDRYVGAGSPAAESARRDADAGTHRLSEQFVPMLDLESAGGERTALPYAMLLRAKLKPGAIELTYSTDTVVIEGVRLRAIHDGIVRHRLATLAVGPDRRGFDDADTTKHTGEPGPRVTAIRVIDRNEQKPASA